MTEDEAKTKWCPFVRYGVTQSDSNAANRWDGWKADVLTENDGTRCIGSACMAWRTRAPAARKYRVADDTTAMVEPPRPEQVPVDWTWTPCEDGDPAGWAEPEESAARRNQGFCGLAGHLGVQ